MPTYRVDVSYDGSNFHGFARNRDVRTVQEELETALGRVFGTSIEVVCAGRTDAGVHARHQVISFTADASIDTRRIQRSINTMLGEEIVATDAMVVADDFSARFSATARAYRYRILSAPVPDPLRRLTTWHVPHALDLAAMNDAAGRFAGEHDFASFCRRAPNRSSVRRVLAAEWVVDGDILEFRISASAFCQQMVRSLTGFCVEVGRGRVDPRSVPDVLDRRDRNAAPQIAPPRGLILWEVVY